MYTNPFPQIVNRLSKAFVPTLCLLLLVSVWLALVWPVVSSTIALVPWRAVPGIEEEVDSVVAPEGPSASDVSVSLAASINPTDGSLVPILRGCDAVIPPGEDLPACCAYGYLYYDGVPVARASVRVGSPYGALDTASVSGRTSGQSYHGIDPTSPPISAMVGTLITFTTGYSDTSASRTWLVVSGGQEVDVEMHSHSSPVAGWEEVGTGSTTGGGISDGSGSWGSPSIAIASDGTLYATWQDDSSGNNEIYVRRRNGSAWGEVGAGSASGGGISNTSGNSTQPRIAMAPDGTPYVARSDNTSGHYQVYVRRWNGSGWEEIGAGSASGGGVSNNNGSSMNPSAAIAPNGTPYVVWADDSSGDYEIYVRQWRSDTITFTGHTITTDAAGAKYVYAADVDGDGDLDVLSASSINDNVNEKVAWYENTAGDGAAWTARIIYSANDNDSSVYAADLDRDGDVDVLSTSIDDHGVTWYENDGGSPPTFTRHLITANAAGAYSVYAADVDGDGDVDVLSASYSDDKIAWYENNGASPPTFTPHVITTNADGASSVYAADVDGDSDIDVLSASFNDDKVAWYENNGASPPTFTPHVITTNADSAMSVYAADVDGDGDMDVLSASAADDKITWYENSGGSPSTFTTHVITTSADSAMSVYAADVDGDGDMDVLSASYRGHDLDADIVWYENDSGSSPTFIPHVITSSSNGARNVYAADVDGDGDLDVIAGYTGDDIAWWEQEGTPGQEVIVFTCGSSAGSNDTELYMVNPDGSNLTRLTDNSWTDWSPSLSPDGAKIAFCSDETGSGVLSTMDIDGGNVVTITDQAGGGPYAWSPDGTKIAFTAAKIYTVELATGDISPVPASEESDRNPDWSLDGANLAVDWAPGDVEQGLFIINLISGTRERVSYTQSRKPAWSPDGNQIAFEYSPDYNLCIINADGTNETQIPTATSVNNPRWSPDGTQIAYTTFWNGQLRIINADGTNDHAVPNVSCGWTEGMDWGVVGSSEVELIYVPLVMRNYRTWDVFYEENDHWLAAYGPLASGQAYLAYPEDTEDYYYFELSAQATVTVSVEDYAPTSSSGTVVLYGPVDGDEQGAYIDHYGPPGHSSMSLGPHSLGPGKYYIRVYTASGHSTTQLYSLTVTY